MDHENSMLHYNRMEAAVLLLSRGRGAGAAEVIVDLEVFHVQKWIANKHIPHPTPCGLPQVDARYTVEHSSASGDSTASFRGLQTVSTPSDY